MKSVFGHNNLVRQSDAIRISELEALEWIYYYL